MHIQNFTTPEFTVTATNTIVKSKAILIAAPSDPKQWSETVNKLNQQSKNYLLELAKKYKGRAELGAYLVVNDLPHTQCEFLILISAGSQTEMNLTQFRKVVLTALEKCKALPCPEIVCYLHELPVTGHTNSELLQHVTELACSAAYSFTYFKTTAKTSAFPKLIFPVTKKDLPRAQQHVEYGKAIGRGMHFTKHLGNLPSAVCTPHFLTEQAKQLALKHKNRLKVSVLGEPEMKKLGMGAFLGVSQGSREEGQLIILHYQGAAKNQAPVALIGKGITFDTGGISLKPADSMVGMKYDMCGAASVLGTIQAIAELQLPINVVGMLAAAENMPDGQAYKPEDILTSLSGQTIEVISTDAEGRLVLADALTYAERFHPDVVIDIATLTGAVVIALGHHATGLISNDDELSADLLAAGEQTLDRAWRLPLWEEYQEQIKSPFADMANTGGRSAGTITAGCFLSRFAKQFRWAHLDIAGTGAMMMGTQERKATGRPVPLLVQYLINRSVT